MAFRGRRGPGCKSDDGFLEPELRRDEDEAERGDGFTEPRLGRGVGDREGSGGTRGSGSYCYYIREDASGKEMEWSEAEVGELRVFFVCGRWKRER